MTKQLSEKELIKLQIQAYEFYAGLIDRAVGTSAGDARMPRWDEQRAVEYRQLAEQLQRRLAELEAQEPEVAEAPAIVPVPTGAPGAGSSDTGTDMVAEAEAAAVSDSTSSSKQP